MGTYNRFTDRARNVMKLANEQALRLHHQELENEHVLLGLIALGSGVAEAILKNLGVDFENCRLQVDSLAPLGQGTQSTGELPLSSRAAQLVETSLREATTLGHNYVGTEHLILALTRQHDGVAAQALANLGLTREEIRREVLNLLGHFVDHWPLSAGVA